VSVAIVIVAGAAEPMLGVALVLMLAGWPRLRRLRADQARLRREAAALPDAIELFVMAVQAGMTAHQAVELVATRAPGPIRPALAEVRRRVERGQQLSDALSALPDLLGPHAAGIADVVSMSERYGTPMAQSLELLARDVAEQRRRRSEAAARTLPVRMSFPLVVCTLPSFVLIAVVPALLAAVGSLGDSAW
jgi:tight adherence protein C